MLLKVPGSDENPSSFKAPVVPSIYTGKTGEVIIPPEMIRKDEHTEVVSQRKLFDALPRRLSKIRFQIIDGTTRCMGVP